MIAWSSQCCYQVEIVATGSCNNKINELIHLDESYSIHLPLKSMPQMVGNKKGIVVCFGLFVCLLAWSIIRGVRTEPFPTEDLRLN